VPNGVDIVVIDAQGNIAAEGDNTRNRLRSNEGKFRIMSDTPGLLVLRRLLPEEERPAEPEESGEFDFAFDALDDFEAMLTSDADPKLSAGARVVLAGEILSPMTLFQMVEIVAERGFQGEMHVFSPDGKWFLLALDQGALLYAKSNHPDDRLGELMVRESVIDGEWLDVLLGDVTENNRLGEVCLERGVLDREQLYGLLRRQTSEIFLRMLLVGDGSYVFTTPDPDRETPAHTVHIPVRMLLMDGIRRLDEVELYRQLIPGDDVCMKPRDSEAEGDLDADAKALLVHCDGVKSLAEMAQAAGLDEFSATRAAYFLVKTHAAAVSSRQQFNEAEVLRVTAAFSEILQDIFAAIDLAGGLETAQKNLSAWAEGSGYTAYLGEDVGTHGMIDNETVLDAMRAAREDDPLATLHHVGHELVAFALFCAGSALTREKELALSKDVNRRLAEIRV